MSRVVIGMDPHKRSATIEAIDEREKILTQGRFGTDTAGYQLMLAAGRAFTNRVWAVEGCYGIGRHIAQRLVADGEPVLDVPPETVGPSPGLRHRPGPQNRPGRRAQRRGRRPAQPRPAPRQPG
jgi:hypothetical protein